MAKCYLRNNSKEIREKILNSGIKVCPCASFNGSIWLDYGYGQVHGVGYCNPYDENDVDNPEFNVRLFLEEQKDAVDCGQDVDLFIETTKSIMATEKGC